MGMQRQFRGAAARRLTAALVLAFAWGNPSLVFAADWVVVASEPGKRVEVDRASIQPNPGGGVTARGRVVLDRPIVDPKTSAAYRIIEVQNRFDCSGRTYATLRRSYYKDDIELLRQEEARSPFDMPVRSGTPDDRMMREACRPQGVAAPSQPVGRTIEKVNVVAADLRQLNDAMVEQSVKKELERVGAKPSASRESTSGARAAKLSSPRLPRASAPATVAWSYSGGGGPENWARLNADYALCANGVRQSPIDLHQGIAVDLEIPLLDYRPVSFRVVDSGRWLQVQPFGGNLSLLGKTYALDSVRFLRPAEFTVAGRSFAMEAQLLHRAADGAQAVVSVLFETGAENRFVQTALNDLPLDPGGSVMPPGRAIDPTDLLPAGRRYFTFMGSLSTPPCAEDVLWLVFKETQQASPEQLAILQRLYPPNARPVQPTNGRIVKESR